MPDLPQRPQSALGLDLLYKQRIYFMAQALGIEAACGCLLGIPCSGSNQVSPRTLHSLNMHLYSVSSLFTNHLAIGLSFYRWAIHPLPRR